MFLTIKNKQVCLTLFGLIISLINLLNDSFAQSSVKFSIIKKPINYNDERKRLSVEYLKKRHRINQQNPVITPRIIVLHFTGSGNLLSNFNYFNRIKIEDGRPLNKDRSELNVSAHYLVDVDGKVYQLIEDTLFARHTIGLNYCAIGVENIGGPNQPLSREQVIANIALIKHLKTKYNIEYVIGHSEYGKFKKSNLWKETDSDYFTYKIDPGDDFMKQIRKGIADLNIKESP
jgi:N-acetylmuramoyl-L-alanine amidase